MAKLSFAIVSLLVMLAFTTACADETKRPAFSTAELTIVTGDKSSHSFAVEVATTPQQHAYGLMFVEKLPPKAGMLFIFDTDQVASFWMRNTLIPLDMIFIRADGSIANIHAGAKPHDETPILSAGPVRAVLEINGGQAAALGITTSSRVYSPAMALYKSN